LTMNSNYFKEFFDVRFCSNNKSFFVMRGKIQHTDICEKHRASLIDREFSA